MQTMFMLKITSITSVRVKLIKIIHRNTTTMVTTADIICGTDCESIWRRVSTSLV